MHQYRRAGFDGRTETRVSTPGNGENPATVPNWRVGGVIGTIGGPLGGFRRSLLQHEAVAAEILMRSTRRSARRACRIDSPRFLSRIKDVKQLQARDHSCRRIGIQTASDHPWREQAATPGLRQADDLPPAVGTDACGHPRGHDHHHAARTGHVPESARGRFAVGHADRVGDPTLARRTGAGIHHRCRFREGPPECAGAGRQHLLRGRSPEPSADDQ